MVEYDTNGGFSIDTLARRLDRAGAMVSDYGLRSQINIYTIDFYMAGAEADELFPSSAELSENGDIEMVQLRLPTFTAEPEGSGMDWQEYESKRRSAVVDVWEDVRDGVGDILVDVLGSDYRYGLIQDDGVTMRAQHGNDMKNVTPHIEFLRQYDGTAVIDTDDLVEIVRRINEMWEKEFFNVETVDRKDL